jgi:hypothetical protein
VPHNGKSGTSRRAFTKAAFSSRASPTVPWTYRSFPRSIAPIPSKPAASNAKVEGCGTDVVSGAMVGAAHRPLQFARRESPPDPRQDWSAEYRNLTAQKLTEACSVSGMSYSRTCPNRFGDTDRCQAMQVEMRRPCETGGLFRGEKRALTL